MNGYDNVNVCKIKMILTGDYDIENYYVSLCEMNNNPIKHDNN